MTTYSDGKHVGSVGAIAWMVGALALIVGLPGIAAKPTPPGFVPDAVIVAFQPQSSLATRLKTAASHRLQPDSNHSSPYVARLKLPPGAKADGSSVRSMVAALKRNPNVRFAEPDYLVTANAVPNDTDFGQLWGLHNTGQSSGTVDADIDAPEAWDITTGSADVIVAVIDTGVDYNHPDLSANILRDAGGNVVGANFVSSGDAMDDNGHGTHCAGTIGALGNNSLGVIGVCPTVRIMPVKFLHASGTGSNFAAVQSIDFARTHGAHIMSNSWGGSDANLAVEEAIKRANDAGILFVAAAGNDNHNNDGGGVYPACYSLTVPNVIAVAATTRTDVRASFSNFGVTSVDLAAPGEQIRSTWRDGYRTISGTSMACPHVSGAAALLLSKYPDLSATALEKQLLDTVDHPAGLAGKVRTGRLNVASALNVEKVAPVTTASVSPAANAAGWHTSRPVTVTLDAADNAGGLGVRDIRYSVDGGATTIVPGNEAVFELNTDGVHTVTFFATDYVDNQESQQSLTVKIDTILPVTTPTVSPVANSAGWNNGPVTVALDAADTAGGSGVKQIRYALDGGAPIDVSGNHAEVSVTLAGQHELTFFASDNAANQETQQSVIVRIDTVGPTTTAVLSPAAGPSGWHTGSVSVDLSATDPSGGSGVKEIRYTLDGGAAQSLSGSQGVVNITSDGAHTLKYSATDVAGNEEAEQSLTVRIDSGGPVVTAAVNPNRLWPANGKLVAVTVSGRITDGAGVDPSSGRYRVTDEYGEVQPFGKVTIRADGTYSFVVKLPASRLGTDLDGRRFALRVSALDVLGNEGSAQAVVLVPHSQGK